MERLLSAQQVADGLGMHVKTLYRLLRDNQIALPFIRKHGRMIAFRPSDVEQYLETHTVNPNGAGLRKDRKPGKPGDLITPEVRRDKPLPGFMSDSEAQEFFKGCQRDAEGNYILHTGDEN